MASLDLPIKQRLCIGFGCIIVLVGIVALSAHNQYTRTRETEKAISDTLMPGVMAAHSLVFEVDQQRTALRAYITTGEEKFYESYEQAVLGGRSAMEELRGRLDDPDERAMLAEIEKRLAQMEEDASHAFVLVNSRGSDVAYRYHQERISPHFEEISGMAEKLAMQGSARVNAAAGELGLAMDRLASISLTSFVAAIILALLFTIMTVRSITRPARNIALAADAISKGDYGKAVALDKLHGRGPEAGEISMPKSELRRTAVAVSSMARTLQQREHSLLAHADISSVCASTIELDRLLDDTLAAIARHTDSQVGVMYLMGDEGLSAQGTFGISPEAADTALEGPEGLVNQVAKSREPIVLSDIPDDTRFAIQPGLGKIIPSSIACLPMLVKDETLGVVVLASLHNYDDEKIALMRSAVSQMGLAFSHALRHMEVQQLVAGLREVNEQLDAQNEELQAQNEELQAQAEEIQAQNEELQAQRTELQQQQQVLQQTYEHQRSIAETLQKSFLPSEHPPIKGYEIADAYVPALEHAQVGGDFYDVIELGDGVLGVVIGDVSGKGVVAAVHTAMAKYMLHAFAYEDPEPQNVLTRLNDAMSSYIHGEAFVTLFYGLLYSKERRLVYANAGHELPLIFKPGKRICTALDSTGPALGVMPGSAYSQVELQLAEDDVFILYTDGITETRRNKEFLGCEGLERMIVEAGEATAHEMASHILASVREYADNDLHDDIALVVIQSGRQTGVEIGQ